MKPILVRLFAKRQNGVKHVGFVRRQRFYPVQGLPVSEGVEALVKKVHAGSPVTSGEYLVSLNDPENAVAVTCRTSFPI